MQSIGFVGSAEAKVWYHCHTNKRDESDLYLSAVVAESNERISIVLPSHTEVANQKSNDKKDGVKKRTASSMKRHFRKRTECCERERTVYHTPYHILWNFVLYINCKNRAKMFAIRDMPIT